jgi:hypothetical protein
MMSKLLIGLIGAGVIATSGYAAASGLESDPARTVSLPAATDTVGTTTSAAATTDDANDVSGPCDEAEHANDPRCAGSPAPAPVPSVATGDDDGPNDVSGPCDEAEHANDPRCAGGAAADEAEDGDDDRCGRGSDDDGAGEKHDDDEKHADADADDRSGSNSGKG